jgi:hypothetical protein
LPPPLSGTPGPWKRAKKKLDKTIDRRVKISISSIVELGVRERDVVKSIGNRRDFAGGCDSILRRGSVEERR